jgi:uncharacterized protein YlzI (FlbEa/FlbD family)
MIQAARPDGKKRETKMKSLEKIKTTAGTVLTLSNSSRVKADDDR